MSLRFLFLSAVIFSIGACSAKPTAYQSTGWMNSEGYTEEKQFDGVFKVHFQGIGFTSPETAQELLDRRCAEITVREGYDWFVYYNKGRSDSVGFQRKSVPVVYGTIHLKKGPLGEDGLDPKVILAKPLPEGVVQN